MRDHRSNENKNHYHDIDPQNVAKFDHIVGRMRGDSKKWTGNPFKK